MKFYTSNDIETAKMTECRIYLQKSRVPLNYRLGTMSHLSSILAMSIIEDPTVTVKYRQKSRVPLNYRLGTMSHLSLAMSIIEDATVHVKPILVY